MNPVPPPRSRRPDAWLLVAGALVAALYLGLVWLKPRGEGWGYGWNMIGYLVYAAPTAWAAGGVALWRRDRQVGRARTGAGWLAAAAAVFPLVCVLVIRWKA